MKEDRFLRKQSRISETLKPGASLSEVVHLTDIFEIARPGKYSVQVAREVPSSLGRGIVRSNKVVVVVVPSEGEGHS